MIGENMSEKEIVFCKSGGCTAKLGAGVLEHILERLPKGKKDENLLVGYDSKDDAAVYRLNERQAVVQTLDFFPPMVEDPYIFGKIAATNALSDIYAMGGEVKTAEYALPGTKELAQNALAALGNGAACLLANHGAVCVGKDANAAFKVCNVLEMTAHIYYMARSIGEPEPISREDVEYMRDFAANRYRQDKN